MGHNMLQQSSQLLRVHMDFSTSPLVPEQWASGEVCADGEKPTKEVQRSVPVTLELSLYTVNLV